MKKFISSILLPVLLFSTIGIVVEQHYSMGEIYDIAIFAQAESCCDTECGCCSEDSRLYRLQEEYTSVAGITLTSYSFEDLTFAHPILVSFDINHFIHFPANPAHAPPGMDDPFSSFQVFRL